MRKVIFCSCLVIALLGTSAAFASDTGGFVGVPGIIGTSNDRVYLGPNLTVSASNTINGCPEAVFRGTPQWVDMPAFNTNISEMNKFRYLQIRIDSTDIIDNPDRVTVEAEISTSLRRRKSVPNCYGNAVIDLEGLAPGVYSFKARLINTLGKKRFRIPILFGLNVATGRVTQKEPVVMKLNIFDSRYYLNNYAAMLYSSSGSFNQALNYDKRTIMNNFMKTYMPRWQLTVPDIPGHVLEERGAMNAKGVGLPFDPVPTVLQSQKSYQAPPIYGSGSYTISLVRGGQPYHGQVTLYTMDGGQLKSYSVSGPQIVMENAKGIAEITTDPNRGWVSYNTASGEVAVVPVY